MAGNCNRCNKQIFTTWRTAKGKHYHPQCFTCAICNSAIEESVNEREDYNLKEIYCLDCHNQYFKKHGESLYDDERNSDELVTTTQSGISSCCISTHFYLDNSPKGDEDHKEHLNKDKFSDVAETLSTNLIYKKKSLQKPLQNFAQESITNVITGADSYSERRKQQSNPSKTFLIRKESSKIPRPTSLSKLSEHDNNLSSSEPDKNNNLSNYFSKISRVRSTSQQPSSPAPLRPQNSKINDYLNSKGRHFSEKPFNVPSKPRSPLKSNHSYTGNTPSVQNCGPKSHPSYGNYNRSVSSLTHAPSPKCSESKVLSKPINSQADLPTISTIRPRSKSSQLFVKPLKSPSSSEVPYIQNQKSKLQNKSQFKLIEKKSESKNAEPKRESTVVEEKASFTFPLLPSNKQLLSTILGNNNNYGIGNIFMNSEENKTQLIQPSRDETETLNTACCKTKSRIFDCPICFEPLMGTTKSGSSPRNSVTGCGHIFHQECIYSWIAKCGNNRCPICSKLCLRESIMPVYVDANIAENINKKANDNDELELVLETLRIDYKRLETKYKALVEEHSECGMKTAIANSLRTAYEMECRNRVQLQWENKRLQRTVDELKSVVQMQIAQGDSIHNSNTS